jgi:heme exporter protein B
VPVLIFGTLAVQSTLNSQSSVGYLSLMLVMLSVSVSLAPLASAAALRISVN